METYESLALELLHIKRAYLPRYVHSKVRATRKDKAIDIILELFKKDLESLAEEYVLVNNCSAEEKTQIEQFNAELISLFPGTF